MNVERECLRNVLRTEPEWAEQRKVAERMVPFTTHKYREHGERVALRCALRDGVSLCDALVRDIERQHVGRDGRVSVAGQQKATVAKLCAEALWLMRDRIQVTDGIDTSPDCNDANQQKTTCPLCQLPNGMGHNVGCPNAGRE